MHVRKIIAVLLCLTVFGSQFAFSASASDKFSNENTSEIENFSTSQNEATPAAIEGSNMEPSIPDADASNTGTGETTPGLGSSDTNTSTIDPAPQNAEIGSSDTEIGENDSYEGEYILGDGAYRKDNSFEKKDKISTYAAGSASFSIGGTANYAEAYKGLALVNAQRAKVSGLAKLSIDADLMEAAMQRAAEIAVLFDHIRPDGDSYYFVHDKVRGENIFGGAFSASTAMSSWMDSTGHRENILWSGFTTIGIGSYTHNGVTFWVQLFGNNTPKSWTQKSNRNESKNIEAVTSVYSFSGSKITISNEELTIGGTTQCYWSASNPGWPYAVFVPNPNSITWTSSNAKIASINSSGQLKGVATGSVTVRGSLGTCATTTKTAYVLAQAPKAPSSSFTGWSKSGGYWYYYKSGKAQRGWVLVRGVYYFLSNSDYRMQTGWIRSGGKWYYLKSSGVMATGWVSTGGQWYFLRSNGAMATGWIKDKNKWYLMKAGGEMSKGWVQIGSSWYHLKSSGVMSTGWLKYGGQWYYLKSSGVMATGRIKDNGKWYNFNGSGVWVS